MEKNSYKHELAKFIESSLNEESIILYNNYSTDKNIEINNIENHIKTQIIVMNQYLFDPVELKYLLETIKEKRYVENKSFADTQIEIISDLLMVQHLEVFRLNFNDLKNMVASLKEKITSKVK